MSCFAHMKTSHPYFEDSAPQGFCTFLTSVVPKHSGIFRHEYMFSLQHKFNKKELTSVLWE